jgi:hypothetical protein
MKRKEEEKKKKKKKKKKEKKKKERERKGLEPSRSGYGLQIDCLGVYQNKIKQNKTTAPRIPAWSPTVVLTGRHSG